MAVALMSTRRAATRAVASCMYMPCGSAVFGAPMTTVAANTAPALPKELYNPPAVATYTLDAGAGAAQENANTQFAVVAVGASQYKVTPGDVLIVDKVKDAVVGQEYTFADVLLVGSQSRTVVGRPAIAGATVTADVEQQTHAKRIRIFKNRQRSTFQRTKGYRRQVTVFRIKDVSVEE